MFNIGLRKEAYSGAVKMTKFHEHEFGEEMCDDESEDIYYRVCKTCNHRDEYEKL